MSISRKYENYYIKITEVNLVITLVQNIQQKIVIELNNFISVELIWIQFGYKIEKL